MNAKKITIFCLGVILFGFLSRPARAADDPTNSVWAAEPPKLDGLIDDWAGVPRGLDKGLSVEYAFRNDDQNLFVLLVFKNPKLLSTIGQTGVTLYFSPEGKKDKSRGIRFIQKAVNADELIAVLEREGKELTDERKQQLRAKSAYVLYDSSIVDDKDRVLGPASGSGPSIPPGFRPGRSGGDVVYEFRLPLVKSTDHPAGIGAAPGQSLKAGVSWGGMTKEMRDAQIAGLSAQGVKATDSGGDLSLPQFDGEGSTSGRGTPSLEALLRGPKRHTFWTDVILAAPEAK